jgi:hypothetical protein
LIFLYLNYNKLYAHDIKYLADALRYNKHLEWLDLSGNPIDNDGAKHLAKALKHNKSLKYLILSDCEIGNEGAKVLFEHLSSQDSQIVYLDVSHNHINFAPRSSNDKLKFINLLYNPLESTNGNSKVLSGSINAVNSPKLKTLIEHNVLSILSEHTCSTEIKIENVKLHYWRILVLFKLVARYSIYHDSLAHMDEALISLLKIYKSTDKTPLQWQKGGKTDPENDIGHYTKDPLKIYTELSAKFEQAYHKCAGQHGGGQDHGHDHPH